MTLRDRIADILGHNRQKVLVEDSDPQFEERVAHLDQEQQEVETRLRALGTTVDVRLRRLQFGDVHVEVETERE